MTDDTNNDTIYGARCDRCRFLGTRQQVTDHTCTTDTDAATLELGCYIDGHHGIYAIERLADLVAVLAPTRHDEDDAAIIHHHLYGDDDESITLSNGQTITRETATIIALGELYDELTAKLPTTAAVFWEWSDGGLFLSPTAYVVEVSARVVVDRFELDTEYASGDDAISYAWERIEDNQDNYDTTITAATVADLETDTNETETK